MNRLINTAFSSVSYIQKRTNLLHKKFNEKQGNSSLNKIFSDAEKILKDKSFKNINWLLSAEISDLGVHIQNVRNIQHPIADEARNIIYNNGITWGMIVMLFSKLTEKNINKFYKNKSKVKEILQIQHTVAKVTQMLYMTIRIHKSVANLNSTYLNYGNKVAILSGDYFLAKCLNELASLRDQDLVEYMASAWRDLTITQYIGPRDINNMPYPSKPKAIQKEISFLDSYSCELIQISNSLNNSKTDWILRNTLGDAGLLGKACGSILKLAGYSEHYQNIGFSFGKYFGLAYQVLKDINNIHSETDAIDLISLPVLLHLRHDPELYEYIEKYKDNAEDIDSNLIRCRIMDGNALEEGYNLQKQYAKAANCILDTFGTCDAKILLEDILVNIKLGNNI